ncbi:MAG: 30S ribosomal protein S6 [bacterium]
MNNYELLYIVSNQYTEKELVTIQEKVNALITKLGGQVHYKDFMGKKKLAYPIDKMLHGYYTVCEFEITDNNNVKELSENLRLDKEVLRHIIIAKAKITPDEIKKKEEMKKREEADEREASRPVARERRFEDKETPTPTPVTEEKVEEKKAKVKTKALDEKLDEILKEDTVV